MANGVQHPDRPGEVALVLRGDQGVGKGIGAREYGALFGQHFVHVAQARHLTGNFNGHLRDAVVVFADEAFGTHDKEAEAVLKALITEPTITIEQKYRDVVTAKNVTHLIVASNHAWVVPAGLGERRFFVLDVSSTHRQDHPYFNAVINQMENGGREAMLYDLQHLDLSGINLRQAPQTQALQEQKVHSLSPPWKWWFGKLMDGQLLDSDNGWQAMVERSQLQQDYINATGPTRDGLRSSQTELGLLLKSLLPGDYPHTRQRRGGQRFWELPPLEGARRHFESLTSSSYQWAEEPDVDAVDSEVVQGNGR